MAQQVRALATNPSIARTMVGENHIHSGALDAHIYIN